MGVTAELRASGKTGNEGVMSQVVCVRMLSGGWREGGRDPARSTQKRPGGTCACARAVDFYSFRPETQADRSVRMVCL